MGVEVIAAAALAVTAASAYEQNRAQRRAADAQEDAAESQRNYQASQQRENRRQTLREERIRRARILQASENTGVTGSSSQMGSIGALATNTGARLGQQLTQQNYAAGAGQINQRIADASVDAQTWGAVGQLSGSVFGNVGGFGALGVGGNSSSSGNGQSGTPGGQRNGGQTGVAQGFDLYDNVFTF